MNKKEMERLEKTIEAQSEMISELFSENTYLKTQLELWKKKKVMFCKEYCDNLNIN